MLQIQCHLLSACVFIFQYIRRKRDTGKEILVKKLVNTGYTGHLFLFYYEGLEETYLIFYFLKIKEASFLYQFGIKFNVKSSHFSCS